MHRKASKGITFATPMLPRVTYGVRLKVTGGKQPPARYLMTATGLFCFSQIRRGYVAGFGTKRPLCISWVTALAGCLGIEITSLGPLQSSTPWRRARILAFVAASSSLAQTSGTYPLK
jgi:hypothetical protein